MLFRSLVAETHGVQVALGGGAIVTFVAVVGTWLGSPGLRVLHPARIGIGEAGEPREPVTPAGGEA